MSVLWLIRLLLSITFVSSAVIQECVDETQRGYFQQFTATEDKIKCEDLYKWIQREKDANDPAVTRTEIAARIEDCKWGEFDANSKLSGEFLIKDFYFASWLGIDMNRLCKKRSIYSEHVKEDPPTNGKCYGLRLNGISLCKLGAYKGIMLDFFSILKDKNVAMYQGKKFPKPTEYDLIEAIKLQFFGFPVGADKTITDLLADHTIENFKFALPKDFNPDMPMSARTPSFLQETIEKKPEILKIPKNDEQCNIDEYTKFPLIDNKAKVKMGVIHEYDLRDPVNPSSTEQLKSAGFGAVGLVKMLAKNMASEAFTAFPISEKWLLTAGHAVLGWGGESPEISKNVPNNGGYKYYPGFNGIHSLISKTEYYCVHSHQYYIQVTPSKWRTMSTKFIFHTVFLVQLVRNMILL